jgi:hypothetical protein
MGLRDLLRKYKDKVDTSSGVNTKGKSKIHQKQQQQQKENADGIKPLDRNAPM